MASEKSIIVPTLKECSRCNIYVSAPLLGHHQCSKHRLCTGETGWEPEGCVPCRQFCDKLRSLSTDDKTKALKDLEYMLSRTSNTVSKTNSPWIYHEKKTQFLGTPRDPTTEGIPQSPMPSISGQSTRSIDTDGGPSEVGSSLPQTASQVRMGSASQVVDPSSMLVDGEQLREVFFPFFQQVFDRLDSSLPVRTHSYYGSPGPSKTIDMDHSDLTEHPPSHFDSVVLPVSNSPESHIHMAAGSNELHLPHRDPFWDFDHMWIPIKPHHKIEGPKILFDGQFRLFKRHPMYHDAFRIITQAEQSNCTYMTAHAACEILSSFFHADRNTSDKFGPNNRSFSLQLPESSGLSDALQVLRTSTPYLLQQLLANDSRDLEKAFKSTDFDDAFLVNITSGWNFSQHSDYFKWAKGDPLCMDETTMVLELPYTIYVPQAILKAEKTSRSKLAHLISAFLCLDRLIAATSDTKQSDAMLAVARAFLPNLKEATFKWIADKYDVRLAALQFSVTPRALGLYRSDVWEHTLFSTSAVKLLLEQNHSSYGVMGLLGLTTARNRDFRSSHHKFEASAKSFTSRKNGSTPKRPFLDQQQQPGNKPGPSNKPGANSTRGTGYQNPQSKSAPEKDLRYTINKSKKNKKPYTKGKPSQTSSSCGSAGSTNQQS